MNLLRQLRLRVGNLNLWAHQQYIAEFRVDVSAETDIKHGGRTGEGLDVVSANPVSIMQTKFTHYAHTFPAQHAYV